MKINLVLAAIIKIDYLIVKFDNKVCTKEKF